MNNVYLKERVRGIRRKVIIPKQNRNGKKNESERVESVFYCPQKSEIVILSQKLYFFSAEKVQKKPVENVP